MCAMRLVLFKETNNQLNAKQYGFRKYISAIDALQKVMEYIFELKRRGVTQYMLTHAKD